MVSRAQSAFLLVFAICPEGQRREGFSGGFSWVVRRLANNGRESITPTALNLIAQGRERSERTLGEGRHKRLRRRRYINRQATG